jgi:hypothetical protein
MKEVFLIIMGLSVLFAISIYSYNNPLQDFDDFKKYSAQYIGLQDCSDIWQSHC